MIFKVSKSTSGEVDRSQNKQYLEKKLKNYFALFQGLQTFIGLRSVRCYINQIRMEQQHKTEIIDVLHAKNPDYRQFAENFVCYKHVIAHQNRLQVQKTEGKAQSITIRNYFANIDGDRLVKVTEIQVEDRLIQIMDVFTCTPCLQENSVTKSLDPLEFTQPRQLSQQKKPLEKRQKGNHSQDQQEEYKVRDTKNVVKNIFRLFQSWIEQNRSSSFQLYSALEQCLLNNKEKYNNRLINNLSKHNLLRQAFMAFSQYDGEELIGSSRINDKQSHVQALKNYRKMCLGEDLLSSINNNQKRKELTLHNRKEEQGLQRQQSI